MSKCFLGWENIKSVIRDLYETWSNKDSRLSSKRIERTAFTATSIFMTIGCFVYLWQKGTLVATDIVVLTTPLLVAGGYNLNQSQKEKKDEALNNNAATQ